MIPPTMGKPSSRPPPPEEIRRVLALLKRKGLRFVVVGGFALHQWVPSHRPKDLDIVLCNPARKEARAVFRALIRRGYSPRIPTLVRDSLRWRDLKGSDERAAGWLFRGWPVRLHSRNLDVDFSRRIAGLSGPLLWRGRVEGRVAGVRCFVASPEDLVRNKEAILENPWQREVQKRKAMRHLVLLAGRDSWTTRRGKEAFQVALRAVREGFYTPDGKPQLRLKAARRAIEEYEKDTGDRRGALELWVCFVETGNRFTLQFGDIHEGFYGELLEAFGEAVRRLSRPPDSRWRGEFRPRLERVVRSAKGIGWGYGDGLAEMLARLRR